MSKSIKNTKKILLSTVFTTLIFITSCGLIYNAPLRHGDVVFSMTDKKGDDNGAGKVKYPDGLQNQSGLFDITKFEVKQSNKTTEFIYNLANINNEYENKNGFSHVLIDTYINVSDEGLNTTLEYGAAVTFNENYPWLYHIRITPEKYYIEKITNTTTREVESIDCEITLEGKTIIIKTDSKNINENLKLAKYYVFTGGYDIFGSDNYRRIVSEENEWNFYGGIDSLYQPNILDVVSPVQKNMLVYFMPPMYAILSPVFNQTHQLLFKKETLYVLAIMLFGIKYFSLYRQYKKEKSISNEDITEVNIDVKNEEK